MSLVPSRRTLAALIVAATLASVFPRSTQALPVLGPRDHSGLVEPADRPLALFAGRYTIAAT